MKVLILSCNTGGGHNSCARYILQELKENNIDATFEDFYDIVNVSAKELSSKIYLSTLGRSGKIFKGVYKLGELYSKSKVKSPVYLVNNLHAKSLYNYIINNGFDLVIATHLFPALTLTAINKKISPKKVKFITIATDYEPCPFMEEAKPDYLVMQKGLEERFVSKGISNNILVPSGIPVATNFITKAKNIKEKLKIKDENIILFMLGSMGFGKITTIISQILKIPNTKTIVVCGNNKKLLEQLKQINNDNLIPLGFVDNINDLIFTSTIVLSKPGGLSSTEIASIGKPLIHIYPIPGIETYNANFFAEKKMSLKCSSNDDILKSIVTLLKDTSLQQTIIENQKKYINKNSAQDLVNLIKIDNER